MKPARALGILLALGLAGPFVTPKAEAASAAPTPVPCEKNGNLSFLCGVAAVEDLVALPGDRWIIGSSMQAKGGGGLYLIDPRAKTAKPAALAASTDAAANRPYAGCAAPDLKALNTHGLELRPGPGGRHILYAVNHGGRESIEVFQVDASGAEPRLSWIGCMIVPEGVSANSMAALPDGRLAVSKFQQAGDGQAIDRLLKGEITGAVYIWKPGAGFSELPGSRLSGDNGLAVSPDGKWLYIAVWGAGEVRRVALDGLAPVQTATLDFRPDNLRWAPDGKIFATGQHLDAENRGGPHGWSVVKLDPETMAVTPVARERGRPGFDDATTAIQVGDELWLGTFRGDRIAYMTAK